MSVLNLLWGVIFVCTIGVICIGFYLYRDNHRDDTDDIISWEDDLW